jgi:hypothetical protein
MKSSTIISFVAVAVITLVIGTTLGSFVLPMTRTETITQFSPVTSTQTIALNKTVSFYSTIFSNNSLANSSGIKVFVMNISGSFYYVDDVSSDTIIGSPGYSYFLNGSITFNGVKFETYCPPSSAGCPSPGNRSVQITETVMAGLIFFNAIFPDGSNETAVSIIGDSTYVVALSRHIAPRAGMLVEYLDYNYPNNFPPYHTFLLVSKGIS